MSSCAFARDLTYLPRNEDVETVSSANSVVLKELICDAALDLVRRAQACEECMQHKAKCPNCCLTTSLAGEPYEAIRCATVGDPYGVDPDYNCKSASRFDSTCSQAFITETERPVYENCSDLSAIPHAQLRGCPGLTPSGTTPPVLPTFQGCGPYFGDYHGVCFDKELVGGTTVWVPNPAYTDFVQVCKDDADVREGCAKRSACCKLSSAVCGAGGYAQNCVDLECKTRIDQWERPNKTVKTVDRGSLECWELSTEDCIRLNEEKNNCLNDVAGGTCGACFKKVYADDSFRYSFVAKSNEKVVLLWKLYAASVGSASQFDYFYTRIQVENADGEIVYASPVHQKVFQGSFGVFSAIAVNPSLLHTGEQYFARLYYFINNNTALNLQMAINGAEIVAIKVRE